MMPKRVRAARVQDTEEEGSDDGSRSLSPSVRYHKKKVRWDGRAPSNPTTDSSPEESSDEDSGIVEKTCLTAIYSHEKIGCAYCEPRKKIISVLEDTQETPHFDLMRMLLEQVNPNTLLTSSHADDAFIDMLHDYMELADGDFQVRPFKEFVASRGRDRLLALNRLHQVSPVEENPHRSSDADSHSSRPTNAYDFMRSRRGATGDPTLNRWNALIRLSNFTSVESSLLCISSVGTLLDHIVRERALGEYDDDGIGGLDIRDILSLDQAMQLNADSLMSPQVFEDESHASVHSDKTKEGLVIWHLERHQDIFRSESPPNLAAASVALSLGYKIAPRWSCVLHTISTANTLHSHLKGMKNMPRILYLLKGGKAKLGDWQGLVKFTYHATMLRDTMSELHGAADVDVVKRLVSILDIPGFKDIGIKVNNIVDWEESLIHERVCVRPRVDEDLDNRKYTYHGIDSVLSSVAEQISETDPPDYTTSLNVVYFPQLGYLICVPMSEEWCGEAGIQALEGWTFQFSSEANVYFKSQEMNDLDIHVGDLHSTIVDRELEILQELLEEVLVCYEFISSTCDVCAELDCLLSFAEATRQYDYQRPEMVNENIIEIVQGMCRISDRVKLHLVAIYLMEPFTRHPLHERIVDTFVSNDARLVGGAGIGSNVNRYTDGERWNSVMLCTGANACGKSVYLKQIALIQIMAQVGCFVPADYAKLGLVDKIFTRVSTRESVSKIQSAFMIDLAQVSLALRNCTSRSLLILDEFGKGTLSTDGAGLFCGVIKHLLNRGKDCPKVLVATHFHVFDQELLDPEGMLVSFRHMQVMFTSSSGAPIESRSFGPSPTRGSTSPSISDLRDGADSATVGPREKITYLYRVAEGLSLESHAAKCAEIFGIPRRIVERAQYVTNLLNTHKLNLLLDEKMSDAERADLEDAEAVCRRFLEWDLESDADCGDGQVKAKLGRVIGKELEDG